ncbi:MAG: choice-of-anchor D domain-containing protein [Bacteroidales bacterium]|nr:choice-of-anchor D domain-containing protein [Bacteroidales bacterium]
MPYATTNIFVSPTQLEYGNILVGNSQKESFFIINTGNKVLNVTGITSSSSNFTINTTTPFSLAQGENKEVVVTFTPTENANYSTQIQIANNDELKTVTLTGTGIQGHFTPVAATGKPYSVIIEDVEIEGIQPTPNDQIGVFDGNLCVGTSLLSYSSDVLQFDGAGDYVVTPNMKSYFPTESLTLEIWFKADAAGVIVSENGNTTPSSGWYDSQLEILSTGEVKVSVWNVPSISLGKVEFGTWHHIALSYNDATNTLSGFLDGVKSTNESIAERSSPWESGYDLHYQLGAGQGTNMGSGAYLKGQVDEFRVWNYARTESEIRSSMLRSLSSSDSRLVGYWTLEQGKLANNSSYTGALVASGNAMTIASNCPVGSKNLLITTWEKDAGMGLPGFTVGNPISFKVYTTVFGNTVELDAVATFLKGNGTFGNGSYTVATLSANLGKAPLLSIPISKLNVGQIKMNDTITNSFYIYNKGTAPLELTFINPVANFKADLSSATIPVADSVKVTVTFTSTTMGNKVGVFQIVSNDPLAELTNIQLEGFVLPEGVPNIDISTSSLTFGTITKGEHMALTFNVINNGTAPLNITNITSSSGIFTVSDKTFTLQNTNDNKEITVNFNPIQKGFTSTVITITSNAGTRMVTAYGIATDGHFQSVAQTGLPYSIVVSGNNLSDYLQAGDEIAVFDGSKCVGKSEMTLTGHSLYTPASNDYMTIPAISLPAAYTIEAWVKFPLPSTSDGWRTLCQNGGNHHHIIFSSDGQLGIYNGGFYTSGYNANTLQGWNHISAVASGTTTQFYVNGKLVGTSATKEINPLNYLGNYVGGGQNVGTVDEFRVWNYARSQNEIAQTLHSSISESMNGLIANYTFNYGAENQANPSQIGTLNNTASITGEPALALQENIQIVAWQKDDKQGYDGFTSGNPITFKVWSKINGFQSEFAANAQFIVGDGTFGFGSMSVVELDFITPIISVNPQEIFKALAEPDSTTVSFDITNNGLGMLQFTLEEVVDSLWLELGIISDSVLPGETLTIPVKLNSTGLLNGVHFNKIRILNNSIDSPVYEIGVRINVTGKGEIATTPDKVDFDSVLIDKTVSQQLTIKNIGTKEIIVDSIKLYNGSEFKLGTLSTPFTLKPADQKILTISFSPDSSGIRTDSLLIYSEGGVKNILISGFCMTPPKVVVNKVLIKGNYAAEYSYTDTILIINKGIADLEFSLKNSVPWLSFKTESGVVKQSDTAIVEINISTYDLIAQPYSGNFTLITNDPEKPTISFSVDIKVSGQPELVADDFHQLGEVIIDQVVYSTYIIKNTGADTLKISELAMQATGFEITNAVLPIIIPPKKQDTLNFTFAPTEVKSYSAVLAITSNDLSQSPYNVAITGEGLPVPPEIYIASDTLIFETSDGETLTKNFSVGNRGGQDLVYEIGNATNSGKAITLDGVKDYVSVIINNSIAPKDEITIEAWIKPTEIKNTYSVVSKEGSTQSFNLKLINGKLSLFINGKQILTSSAIIKLNELQHIAASYDGFYASLFYNGTKISEAQLTISPNTENVRIGRSFGGEFFKGTIDEVRIWNVARNDQAIEKYKNIKVSTNSANLVLYFDFETIANNVFIDNSLYKNKGTIYGNVLNSNSTVSLNSFFSFNPLVGSVLGDENQDIEVTCNSELIPEGTYYAFGKITSNDKSDSVVFKPIKLIHTGTVAVNIAKDTVRFKPTYQTSSDTSFITLENTGTAPLVVSNITFSDLAFSAKKSDYIIPAFSGKLIPIFFGPSLAKEYIGEMQLTINVAGNETVTIPLKGIGVKPPIIELSSKSMSVQTEYLKSIDSSLTIYNTGSGILEYNFVSDQVSWLTFDPAFGNIAAGDSVTINLIFDPSVAGGIYTANIILNSNALNEKITTIAMQYTVIGAKLSLSPEMLTDTTTIGELITDTLIIQNVGPEPLSYSLLEYSYWMSLSKIAGIVLPNSSEKIIVTFDPNVTAATYSYDINIKTNDVNAKSIYYRVNYTVLPEELLVSPTSLFIGGVLLGQSSSSKITLFNNSKAIIKIDSVTVDKPFTSSTINGISILPGLSRYVDVSIKATEKIMYSGSANVFTSDGKKYTISVSAEGIEKPYAVTNMLPVDSAIDLSKPLNFSWAPALDAKNYTILIANSDSTKKIELKNITGISYSYIGHELAYGETYTWQVISHNYQYSTPSVVQSFTLRELPDLIVSSITVPKIAFSGRSTEIQWQVDNVGIDKTIDNWFDYAYLSLDTIFHSQFDIYLGGLSNVTYLEKGESYNQIHEFTLPNGISGNYYVIVKTNARANMPELNVNNNSLVSDTTLFIDLTPPPDLRVFSISVPDILFSGQEATIQWNVKNYGSGPTAENVWIDNIYISDTTEWAAGYWKQLDVVQHTGIIASDSSYTVTTNIKIPESITGNYFIHIFTDSRSQVYEHASEQNNTKASSAMQVILTPPADLVVSEIAVSKLAAATGDTITVEWVVNNEGGSATKANWYDGIYLLPLAETDPAKAVKVGEFLHSNSLELGNFASCSKNIIIPNSVKGINKLFVKTDISNAIDELDQESNNTSDNKNIDILYSDFVITNCTKDDTVSSGDSTLISFYLKNIGNGVNKIKNVQVILGLSNKNYFDKTAQVFAELFVSPLISPSDSVLVTVKAKLPDGVYGIKKLLIVADNKNDIYEGDFDNNNTLFTDIAINLNRWVDLSTTEINNADTIKAGSTSDVSYTIKNIGNRDLIADKFISKLYLIEKDRISCGIACGTELMTITKSVSLAVGDSLIDSLQITIPNITTAGNYVFYLVLDVQNSIFEHLGENNNVQYNSVFIDKIPVDFLVDSVDASTEMWSSKIANFSWRVTNIGTTGTIATTWNDAVYLSKDSVFGNDDILIAKMKHAGRLFAKESYTVNANLTIPNGVNGDYHVFVFSDIDYLTSDNDYSNNYDFKRNSITNFVEKVKINLSPSPDLEVIKLVNTNTAVAGQPLKIEYIVKNSGEAAASESSWTDKFYLSTKTGIFEIDYRDFYVGSYTRIDSLKADDSYTVSIELNIPLTATGNYLLVAITDKDNKIYEHNAEGNNTLVSPLEIQLPPPSDLVVNEVTAPLKAVAGESVTIGWTVQNIGENPAQGYKKDIVYLSKDSIIDDSDIVFGIQSNWINLAPSGITSNSMTARLLNASAGYYNVIVKTDVLDNIYELSDTNNATVSLVKLFVDVKSIGINDSITDKLENDIELYYKITVTKEMAGETVLLKLYGDDLNALNELYVKYDEMPSRSSHDYSYSNLFSGSQEIILPDLLEGTYYILIIGNNIAGTIQDISLSTKVMKFELLSINNDIAGNSGKVTVKLTGAKFTPNMDVMLQLSGTSLTNQNNPNITYRKFYVPTEAVNDSIYFTIWENNKINSMYINSGATATESNADFKIIGPFSKDTIIGMPLHFAGNYFVTINVDKVLSEDLGLQINKPTLVEMKNIPYNYAPELIVADEVYFLNTTVVFATFNLKNAELGKYHVHLNNHKEYFIGNNMFEIENALPEDLQINVVYPSSMRTNSMASVKIEYKNTGNTDIKAPYIVVESFAGAPISETIEGLSERNTKLEIGLQHPQEPKSVLRPGAYGTKTIYIQSSSQISIGVSKK